MRNQRSGGGGVDGVKEALKRKGEKCRSGEIEVKSCSDKVEE